MNFTINTDDKTITINNQINIAEFIEKIKAMLPDTWMEYDLIVSYTYYPTYPTYPTWPIIQPYDPNDPNNPNWYYSDTNTNNENN